MERELLLKLCQRLLRDVAYLYEDGHEGAQAYTGECLGWYGGVLSKIGWILLWGTAEDKERMFKVMEDAFKNSHLLKCSVEQWLYFKLLEIERDMEKRLGLQEEEQTTESLKQQQEEELPF